MKRPLFIKNIPVDESRISHIETIVSRLARRSRTSATGIVTPFPISSYTDAPVNKVVLRYMFPASGMVTKGAIFIEGMPKEGVNITVSILNALGKSSQTYFTKRRDLLLEPNKSIFAGDRLVIEMEQVAPAETLSGIWIAFLWSPSVKDTQVKQFLIEELDKLEESYGSEIQE
jgi:hypothetical protein